MNTYFLVFKLELGELTNAYSIVSEDILASIDPAIILNKKIINDKLYSKEELEAMRDSMI